MTNPAEEMRERAAKICDEIAGLPYQGANRRYAAQEIAAAIRALPLPEAQSTGGWRLPTTGEAAQALVLIRQLRQRERFVMEGPAYLQRMCERAADVIERLLPTPPGTEPATENGGDPHKNGTEKSRPRRSDKSLPALAAAASAMDELAAESDVYPNQYTLAEWAALIRRLSTPSPTVQQAVEALRKDVIKSVQEARMNAIMADEIDLRISVDDVTDLLDMGAALAALLAEGGGNA